MLLRLSSPLYVLNIHSLPLQCNIESTGLVGLFHDYLWRNASTASLQHQAVHGLPEWTVTSDTDWRDWRADGCRHYLMSCWWALHGVSSSLLFLNFNVHNTITTWVLKLQGCWLSRNPAFSLFLLSCSGVTGYQVDMSVMTIKRKWANVSVWWDLQSRSLSDRHIYHT